MTGDPNLPGEQRSPERWFSTEAFALQAPFTFGSSGRNTVFAPGFASVDMSLQKLWFLEGGTQLECRWEVFNVLDRVNFDLPNRFFGSPNFGRIFSAQERAGDAVRVPAQLLAFGADRRLASFRVLRMDRRYV